MRVLFFSPARGSWLSWPFCYPMPANYPMTSWKRLRLRALQLVRAGPHRSPSRWHSSVSPGGDRLVAGGVTPYAGRHGVPAFATARSGRPLGSGHAPSPTPRPNTSSNSYAPISPEELGIAALKLWTRRAVRDPDPQGIRSRSGGADRRPVSEAAGASRAKRPRCVTPDDQDPEEVRQWLEETYPAIEARAGTGEGAEIHWGDEKSRRGRGPTACARLARVMGKPRPRMWPDPHIRAGTNGASTITEPRRGFAVRRMT